MVSVELITIEFPLNESTRQLLKVEAYFKQIEYYHHQNNVFANQALLMTILELYEFLEKTNFKTVLDRDIEKQLNLLESLNALPTVNKQSLVAIMEQLENTQYVLKHKWDIFGWVKDNYFLSQLSYRISLPMGYLSFDLPLFHQWLNLPALSRAEFLQVGLTQLNIYQQATQLLLHLLRESTVPSAELTDISGLLKHSLHQNLECALIKIVYNADTEAYPEINYVAHLLRIQFYSATFGTADPVCVSEAVPFELTCCYV